MAGLVQPLERVAVVMDLDEALLDRREAWLYAIEESVAAITGTRISARSLLDEYRLRPPRDALRILLRDSAGIDHCEALSWQMYRRSAMKRLLVHEGVGMALDALREARVEVGVISREAHPDALKQIESTGLDRFVTVLSATAAGTPWDPGSRWGDCLRFLDQRPERCAFVSPFPEDLQVIEQTGADVLAAGWVEVPPPAHDALRHPAALVRVLRSRFSLDR